MIKCRDYEYKKVSEGSVVGLLTVQRVVGKSKNASNIWLCLCTCGGTKEVLSSSLNNGLVQSCGCLLASKKPRLTHGKSKIKDPTYHSWTAMKQRCYYPKNENFHLYGGRGVTVCPEWIDSFETFLADMGECPKGLSLDRKSSEGNYSKDNCRWATASQQARNQRLKSTNTSGVVGVRKHKLTGKWTASIRLDGKETYLGLFTEKEDAIAARKQAEIKHNYYGETNGN